MSDSENTAIPAEHMDKPNMTIPEQLDAAQSGEEFGRVLGGFFAALDRARWDTDD